MGPNSGTRPDFRDVSEVQSAQLGAAVPQFFVSVGKDKKQPAGNTVNPEQLWKFVPTNAAALNASPVTGTWTRIDSNIPGAQGVTVWSVAPSDPQQDVRRGDFCGRAAALALDDGGAAWTRDRGLENLMKGNGAFGLQSQNSSQYHPYQFGRTFQPSVLAIHPTNPQMIAAGGLDSGLFLSTDGGTSWRLLDDPLGQGLTHLGNNFGSDTIPHLSRPRFVHFNGNTLYVAGQGRGLWQIDVNFDLLADADEVNNTLGAATMLPQTTLQTRDNRTIHNNADVDYYKFTAQETGKLLVNLSFNGLRGLLDIEVRDSADAVIANTVVVADRDKVVEHLNEKRVLIDVVKGKDYFIRVASAKNAANASLVHTNYYNR